MKITIKLHKELVGLRLQLIDTKENNFKSLKLMMTGLAPCSVFFDDSDDRNEYNKYITSVDIDGGF